MCLICERIMMIKEGRNPYFVCEMETGYVVLGDHQRFNGYTLFLCKEHVNELHDLNDDFKMKYLEEMTVVAEAVFNVYHPDKLNYELLGNGDSHVHWHIFPRVEHDTPVRGPVWWLEREEMWNDKYKLSGEVLRERVKQLKEEIEKMR